MSDTSKTVTPRAPARTANSLSSRGSDFWTHVADDQKRIALLSAEAWLCPPKIVEQFVRGLLRKGDEETARSILQNFASFITADDPESRRSAAVGLAEFAELYGTGDASLLIETLGRTGAQMASDHDPHSHALVCAAFVRLSREALARSCYPAILRAMALLGGADRQRPGLAYAVGPQMGIADRLPRLIESVLLTGRIPDGLTDVLRQMPLPAARALANQFNQCTFHDECESLIELAVSLGPGVVSSLTDIFAMGSPADALEAAGLLSRLDVSALGKFLPTRLLEWDRSSGDRLVRRLAAAGSPERGLILCSIFESLDLLVRPLALDEIGMSGDQSLVPWLLGLVDENSPMAPYLRLKGVEALGRLRAKSAILLLRGIVETKRRWRWVHPKEMRIVALQALENLDGDWVRRFLPHSEIERAELNLPPLDADPYSSCIRQRRYSRLRMVQPVRCETTGLRENARLEILELNLSGGLATCESERSLPSGTLLELKIDLRGSAARVQVFVRRTRSRVAEFEIADISLEDRARLRRFIVGAGSAPQNPPPQSRKRRSPPDAFTRR